MPMYYFHLRDNEKITDVDGTDLVDLAAARTHDGLRRTRPLSGVKRT